MIIDMSLLSENQCWRLREDGCKPVVNVDGEAVTIYHQNYF